MQTQGAIDRSIDRCCGEASTVCNEIRRRTSASLCCVRGRRTWLSFFCSVLVSSSSSLSTSRARSSFSFLSSISRFIICGGIEFVGVKKLSISLVSASYRTPTCCSLVDHDRYTECGALRDKPATSPVFPVVTSSWGKCSLRLELPPLASLLFTSQPYVCQPAQDTKTASSRPIGQGACRLGSLKNDAEKQQQGCTASGLRPQSAAPSANDDVPPPPTRPNRAG